MNLSIPGLPNIPINSQRLFGGVQAQVSQLLIKTSLPSLRFLPRLPLLSGLPSISALPSIIGFPNVTGISSLPQLPQGFPLMTADSPVVALQQCKRPQWGIFDKSGVPVIEADSVVSVEFKKDWKIADYPIENGGFVSYNKVEVPYDAKITFAQGVSKNARAALFNNIEKLSGDTVLYQVVTPEKKWLNANITHYDFSRRSSNGVSLIILEIGVREIRSKATTTFTSNAVASPSAATAINAGTVQAKTPPIPLSQLQHEAVLAVQKAVSGPFYNAKNLLAH